MENLSLIINILLVVIIFTLLVRNRTGNLTGKITNIERDLQNLNNIFTTPFLRGEAGETLLKELIKNYLPKESYAFQYGFRSGARVDAIVRTGKFIIPIDSKFPLEVISTINAASIKKVFKHGEDIAKKYILPNEGTLNFAVMYIPSEKIYYELFVIGDNELQKKLLDIGILVTSPSTLFSFIQTVVYGLKGFTYNQKHGEIIEKMETLRVQKDLLQKQFSISQNHMKNLKQAMIQCEKLIDDIDDILPH